MILTLLSTILETKVCMEDDLLLGTPTKFFCFSADETRENPKLFENFHNSIGKDFGIAITPTGIKSVYVDEIAYECHSEIERKMIDRGCYSAYIAIIEAIMNTKQP